MKVTPTPGCEFCWGAGIIRDMVDYGSTLVPLESYCNCILDQIEDEDEEIVLVPVEELDDREFSKTLPHSAWWDLCPLAFP